MRVRVLGVALDPAQEHVILLKPVADAGGRILPVWIGAQEATSILIAVQGTPVPRPLAHDLMLSMLEESSVAVDRVEVTSVDGGTFFATVTLRTPRGLRDVDARPSDAIALATRADAPIFVAESVLDAAGIPDTVLEESELTEEEDVEEFRRFLDEVEPEDFGS
jgi:uncharacterized protein